MRLEFTKMHGCGNDYIYVDCFKQKIDNPNQLAKTLSDRHFYVGSDGLIMICPSDVADAKMRMFNADGSEGRMCGNAIRCVGKFLYDNGYCKSTTMYVDTLSGIKILYATLDEDGEVKELKVDMGKADLTPSVIPAITENEKMIDEEIEVLGEKYRVTAVSMGSAHCVCFVDDTEAFPLEKVGSAFENHERFPDRVNAEFVQVIDSNTLKMRVWERGSQETAACGTGSCASVVAAVLNGHCKKGEDVTVLLRGGKLVINYTDERVYMTGEAVKVYDGVMEI